MCFQSFKTCVLLELLQVLCLLHCDCDVIWIESVIDCHVAFQLTFVSLYLAQHVFLTFAFFMWPMKKMLHFCTLQTISEIKTMTNDSCCVRLLLF